MKAILINLPQLNALDSTLDPPLGLMYVASTLEAQGISVDIVDLAFIKPDDWKNAIGCADIYGMTTFTPNISTAKNVYQICKHINPTSIVMVGGPHATSLPQETLQFFDCVICGEGDIIDYTKLYKNKIICGQKIKILDDLPPPARHLINLKNYTRQVAGKHATSIITGRGCPYNCIFCCKDVFGKNIRYHSNDRIIEEIRCVKDLYGFDAIIFWDDTFTLQRKRLHQLCKRISVLDIVFRCNGDTRQNTYEDFQLLYDAGCREICFGIESGSQKILDIINKGTTVEQNKQAIFNAKKAGINTKAFLMIGNPGESIETVEETKRFLEEAEPDQFALYQFTPLPGCDVWNNPDKYKVRIVNNDFDKYYYIGGNVDSGMVIETDTLNLQQIKQLRDDLIEYLKKRGQRGNLQNWQTINNGKVL